MSFRKILGGAATIAGGAIGAMVGGPAGAAAGASIGASVGGAITGSAAESAERRSAKEQRRLAQLQAERQRRELIRDVQFGQAMAMVANVASGAGLGTSTLHGQQASQMTMMRDDLGFHAMGGDIADNIWRHTRQADSYRTAQGMFGAIGSMASNLGMLAGPGEFTNLPRRGTVPEGGTTIPAYVQPPGRV